MKTRLLLFSLMMFAATTMAQNVGINSDGSAPHSSAMLDVKSTSGGILIPRMTEAQRDAINSPATGLLVYQTTSPAGFYYFDGSSWSLIGGSAGSETDPVFTASPAQGITGTNITNWNTAYGWGNHASAGYLTSATLTETDPVFTTSPAYGITNDNITSWNGVVSSQWTTSTNDIYFNTGNVAIGTTSPGAYKLNVNGSINGTSVLVNGVAVASSTDTYWETGGSGKIYYNSGNVGIGNATPAYPLDVTGDVNITGNFRVNGTPLTGTGTVTSVSAGNGMNFTAITGSGSVTLGTPSTLTNATTNSVSGTTHNHAITTQLPSSATAGVMLQSGTKTAGGFYGGTTAPSSITRANYDGYLYATRFYGDGSQLTGITATSYSGVLAAANGGTGQSSYAVGDLLYASTTTALSKLADVATGNSLISGGVGVAPSWGKIGLTTHVSGTLAIANGGTGATTAAAARTGLGATTLGGNMFTLTNPSAVTFPRFNADNTVTALSAADFRTAIGVGTGGGTVTSVTGTSPISVATGTTTPVISLSTVPVTSGGTGSTAATVQGGVVYGSSTSSMASTAAGTSGQVLTSNGTNAPTWSSTASIGVAPVGSIMIWAGSTAPTGWLLCDGTAYSTGAYPALYTVIGTTYGTGIGFMVPNLQGRVPVGKRTTIGTFDALNETGGEESHIITTVQLPSHNHTFTGTAHNHTVDPDPFTTLAGGSHTHSVSGDLGGGVNASGNDLVLDNPDGSSGTSSITSGSSTHTHSIDVPNTTSTSTTATGTISNTGSGTAMNVVQPYIVLNYIIKY